MFNKPWLLFKQWLVWFVYSVELSTVREFLLAASSRGYGVKFTLVFSAKVEKRAEGTDADFNNL